MGFYLAIAQSMRIPVSFAELAVIVPISRGNWRETVLPHAQDLQRRLQELHPYELPELIVLPVIGGNEGYLQWVREGVEKDRHTE